MLPVFLANLILRPCDQYPSDPGVLKSRPLSSLSAHSSYGGGSIARLGRAGTASSINSHDDEDYDSESGGFAKPTRAFGRQISSNIPHYPPTNDQSIKVSANIVTKLYAQLRNIVNS